MPLRYRCIMITVLFSAIGGCTWDGSQNMSPSHAAVFRDDRVNNELYGCLLKMASDGESWSKSRSILSGLTKSQVDELYPSWLAVALLHSSMSGDLFRCKNNEKIEIIVPDNWAHYDGVAFIFELRDVEGVVARWVPWAYANANIQPDFNDFQYYKTIEKDVLSNFKPIQLVVYRHEWPQDQGQWEIDPDKVIEEAKPGSLVLALPLVVTFE